ncbi:retrovirus-related pol polyprotein from transposon TNT 1-94 [Tanacetum coccineum]
MKGTEHSYQERECKLYNEFDKFTSLKGETLHEYYLRFSQLINDMHTIGMTMQQVQGQSSSLRTIGNATTSRGNNAAGQARVIKCYNCQGVGHMARQCTQLKRPRNAAWFKEKLMLAEAQEFGQVLDEEQLKFLTDPGITDCHDVQPIIIYNAAF